MPKYNVLIEWTVETWHEVDAESEEQARDKIGEMLDCTDAVPADDWINLSDNWLTDPETSIMRRIDHVENA